MSRMLTSAAALALLTAPGLAQSTDEGAAASDAASGDRLPEGATPFADQALGESFTVSEGDLPEPYEEPGVRNPAVTIERGEHEPQAPEGHEVTLFAEGLTHPRQMYVPADGRRAARPSSRPGTSPSCATPTRTGAPRSCRASLKGSMRPTASRGCPSTRPSTRATCSWPTCAAFGACPTPRARSAPRGPRSSTPSPLPRCPRRSVTRSCRWTTSP